MQLPHGRLAFRDAGQEGVVEAGLVARVATRRASSCASLGPRLSAS